VAGDGVADSLKITTGPGNTREIASLFGSLLQEVSGTCRELQAEGVDGFDCRPETVARLDAWGRPPDSACETLAQIQADLGVCTRCRLSAARTHIVFGEGDPDADLVFVGEGPGYDEDRRGRPFVGAAGQLLTRIIEAMELKREQVYICNIIKCRPPNNRNPRPDEISSCFPFLKRQLQSIAPRFVCALGKFAAQTLLETDTPISRLRGRLHRLGKMKVLPTFHPAYLLRNPEKKRDVWHDMQLLMREMKQ
jgi:DNA polymerase